VLIQINISDLGFNPNLEFGYKKRTELEPDLLEAIEKIKKADHMVWIFPMWWFGCPGFIKSFIDRTFLPGIPYEPVQENALPKKLLKGKTAGIIITADTSKWYDSSFMKSPAIHQFKKGTLEFCGISPVKVAYILPIKNSKINYKKNWLDKTELLGEKRTPLLQKLDLMILACLKQFLYTFYS
jgi:NAD(P)H dehydrogenase (quinone)